MRNPTALCVSICRIGLILIMTSPIAVGQHLESYVVTGAGDATYNGDYFPNGTTAEGDLRWTNAGNPNRHLIFTCPSPLEAFEFSDDPDFKCFDIAAYWIFSATEPPPSTGWLVASGDPPAPQVDVLTLPVELVEFTAVTSGSSVVLRWWTSSESAVVGFEVEERVANEFSSLGFVQGRGESRELVEYDYTVSNLMAGSHTFRLRLIDADGVTTYSDEIEISVAAPSRFSLHPAYPNPFNPSTTISYTVPQAADVTLAVYDMLGRQVTELASGNKLAGSYEVSFDATGLPSGVYVYRLQAGDYVGTKRMVVLK